MKIPKSIKINNIEYKVKIVNFFLNENISGNIDYTNSIMKIKKSITNKKVMEDTFFHEIAHGLLKELEFNHPKITKFRVDEVFVQELGLMLRKIFLDLLKKQKDNKE